jgi:SOS response regulatory protein OraA/RecX
MKKALSIIAGMSMLLSLVSCSNGNNNSESTTENAFHYDLSEEYSDEYVSIKYCKSWEELDDSFKGPAYTISGSSQVHVSYTFFDDDKINNDAFINKNIPSGVKAEDCTYINKNNIKFLKIWRDNVKMYLHATKDCVVHIEFDNCYDMHYELIEDFLDNITIKIPDSSVTKVITNNTTTTKKSYKTTTKADKNTSKPKTTNSTLSSGRENALKKAQSYLSHSDFSYNELIEQLEYEKFSHEDAVYGADNCGADWNAEALEQAKSYISHSAFSYSGLYDQLIYGQFTPEQAQYGVDNCGADWNAEALEQAQSYISHSAFSYSELYDQLIYGQFTSEQAQYGVDNCGADWNAEAVEQAESYLSHSSFSREELYDQLIYEGFTPEQAEHGVSAVY